MMILVFLQLIWAAAVTTATIPLPSFVKMRENYPGYKHAGGHFHNNQLIDMIGCKRDLLLHDTSALRLSYSFNKVGGVHSLGTDLIHLSRTGKDSVTGRDGLQYLYHPIAYGPYLADKYGYPSITKLHQLDPISTKKNFWGKQGILRVITYRKIKNLPVGHVALWDCDHFHETKDWISGHSLITVEFWESPDSNCSTTKDKKNNQNEVLVESIKPKSTHFMPSMSPSTKDPSLPVLANQPIQSKYSSLTHHNRQSNQGNKITDSQPDLKTLLQNKSFRRKFIKKYYVSNGHLRHAKHRGLTVSNNKRTNPHYKARL